jgi:hypothetical protein
MCRRAVLALPPSPTAAGEARRFITSNWGAWKIDDPADEITLAVSELVTNAVLHARTDLEIELCVSAGRAEISVRDHDPRPPVLRPVRVDLLADLDAIPLHAATAPDVDERHGVLHVGASGSVAAGRGLLIVDTLADEWGVAERADGKQVWFAVGVSWHGADTCPCAEHATSTTASGHKCMHALVADTAAGPSPAAP